MIDMRPTSESKDMKYLENSQIVKCIAEQKIREGFGRFYYESWDIKGVDRKDRLLTTEPTQQTAAARS